MSCNSELASTDIAENMNMPLHLYIQSIGSQSIGSHLRLNELRTVCTFYMENQSSQCV